MHNYCQKLVPISNGCRHLPLHTIWTEKFNFPILDQILALANHLQDWFLCVKFVY